MTGKKFAWIVLVAGLCLGATFGSNGRALAEDERPPCTGHGLTRHGYVFFPPLIDVAAEIAVGESDPVRLNWGQQADLGFVCPGREIFFRVRAFDIDSHICLNPLGITNVYNYIQNTSISVQVQGPSAQQTVQLSSSDGSPATTRTWTGRWTVPDGARDEWTFTFQGEVADVECQTFIDGQNHAWSTDPNVDTSYYQGKITIPEVRKIVATQGESVRADSLSNPSQDQTGYATAGSITLNAYSDETGTEQNFPDSLPVWTVQKMPPAAGGGGGGPPSSPPGKPVQIDSGKTVTHNFDEPGVYRIHAQACDSERTMFLTVVKVELIQADNNSPINPRHRMCSNAQTRFGEVTYYVKVTPNVGVNLSISGTAAVTFHNGQTTHENVGDGSVVKLVAERNTHGTWRLVAEMAHVDGYMAEVGEKVFRFVGKHSQIGGQIGTHLKSVPSTGDFSAGGGPDIDDNQIDGASRIGWIETEPSNKYSGYVRSLVGAACWGAGDDLSLTGEVEIHRRSHEVAKAFIHGMSFPLGKTGVSMSLPSSQDGSTSVCEAALTLTELNGFGPNSSSIKASASSFGILSTREYFRRDLRTGFWRTRAFNLGAEDKVTVLVAKGVAVKAANKGKDYMASARIRSAYAIIEFSPHFTIISPPAQ